MFRKKEKTLEEIIKEKGYDPYLLSQIQPFGGLSTRDEKYIKLGDGYVECIHISSYVKNPTLHWLAQLTNISNSIVTVDIQTENISEVKKNINRSVKELNIRYNSASEVTEKADAQLKYQELVNLNSEISAMGETVKDITTRIFLAYRTKDELDKATAKKIKYLEVNDYKGSVYLNEGAAEWKSFYQSYTTKGRPHRKSNKIHQFVIAPLRVHSQKPDIVRDKIIELMGDLPRIELFARQKVDGWDAWGNEVNSDISLHGGVGNE